MSLLARIAGSNGNPERTMEAIRLAHERLEHESGQRPAQAESDLAVKYLIVCLRQIENQPSVKAAKL